MSYEIEIKAHATGGDIKTRLSALGSLRGSFQKEDCYWSAPGQTEGKSVRIRSERRILPDGVRHEQCLVTFKIKERLSGGIEVNRETEFSVSDGGAFANLLEWLSFSRSFSKQKTGEVWDIDGITAELADVAVIPEGKPVSIGRFLELEILAVDDTEGTVETARARLLSVLTACGIGEDRIEKRYYTELGAPYMAACK
jgi:predicted adenylyl cyclase CyaB